MVLSETSNPSKELTMDPWGAPGWVLVHHPENQITSFFGNSLPAHLSPSFGDRTPIKGKPLPVPNGPQYLELRRSELVSSLTRLFALEPKKFVDHSNLWSWMLALEHGELLPESQVFQ
jgi:hypothetical protein